MNSRYLTVVLFCALLLSRVAADAADVHVPDWALPGSAKHKQVPPPAGFHRDTVTIAEPLGIFEGQADVGGPLLPGSASFDRATGRYTITSASYNIWYFRDEFRFLWKKSSGDVSLAADVDFPQPDGYDDRKAVLIIRQDLNDDAKEIMVALHGAGLIHLAYRPGKAADLRESCRIDTPGHKDAARHARIGIEKRGNSFALFFSFAGEPMHRVGPPVKLPFDAPFYVGLGFCSHVPDKADTAVLSNVVLAEAAGNVH